MSGPALEIEALHKTFTLHAQGGVSLPVLHGVSLTVAPGECVMLADPSGAGKSTKADYAPVFNAISRTTGLQFDLKVGQSYGAVVEGMCNQLADIAFFGPVSYVQAHQRGCAQLLAVGVEKGESVYYAGMFAKADAPIASVKDVKGKRVAFGDVNSASSFTFQIAMLMDAGLDPVRDLSAIRMTGSHANSLGRADAGPGRRRLAVLRLLREGGQAGRGRSEDDQGGRQEHGHSLPAARAATPKLPEALEGQAQDAFASVHKAPGVTPDMIRGYGGKKVDAFDTKFSEDEFNVAAEKLALLTDELKGQILKKAAER